MSVTPKEKLACAARELALRRRAYPRFIEVGKMTPHEAQHEIRVMEAIVEDYRAAVRTPDLFSTSAHDERTRHDDRR